jgi:N-glycosylase/DNA lyase
MVVVPDRDFDIAKIAASGQCFRLNQTDENTFRLVAQGNELSIESRPSGSVRLNCSREEWDGVWRSYFDMETDYAAIREAIDPNDAYLSAAGAYGAGIRILRQDPWETLISFILSQRKNIPAIKRCVETLCARFGEPLAGAPDRRAFPSAHRLAEVDVDCYNKCALGYRSGYVHAAAQMVASGELDLSRLAVLPDGALMEALLSVPGVGKKIADCTMLFGFHRLNRFPVDVWIERVLTREYPAGFPLSRYAGSEGVLQQYIFYYERTRQRSKKELP